MGIFNPYTPVYNAIVFYILIIIIILITKPRFLYSHKDKKFKQFGCKPNQTLLSFPVVCILMGIILYMSFASIESICIQLDKLDKFKRSSKYKNR
jgi:uncharacterized membrane protein